MLLAVLSGFLVAIAAPWLYQSLQDRAGWVLALLPAALTVYFATFLPQVMAGEAVVIHYDWVPGLEINLSFLVDGLSLLFALLISLIGTFIVLYASAYLKGDEYLPRFYVLILAFMAAMLGLVLSDNLITLFVFWELTSITSYMLIGHNHEDKEARKCALQGLLVTVGGGLALLAGLILMAGVAGSFSLHEILNSGDVLRDSHLYLPILILVLAGCFTKSAQVPFHFWLPNAMAAPTPVSAYLHSATMVKAGVYLMARLNPSLGGTELWMTILPIVGALTMFTGAYLAVRSTGIKRVLAYSTVMALGTLTMLVGIGTETAMIAFACFLMAHSLYKGALFMVAGAVDHEAGTKDVTKLGGLRRKMPVTATFAAIAALSLAGIPPLFGFVAKELMFESVLEAGGLAFFLSVLAIASAVLVIAVAAIVAIRPFWGRLKETPKKPHEAPLPMLLGPIVLASLSLFFGVLVFIPDTLLVQATVLAVYGEPVEFYLSLWHGINAPLLMSLASLLLGALLFLNWDRVRGAMGKLDWLYDRGPEAGYFKVMDGLVWTADWQTRVLQNGYLRNYILTIVLTTVGLVGYALFSRYDVSMVAFGEIRLHEYAVAGLLVASALFACLTHSRLGAVASAGVFGFAIALIFILFSAPDLGITQILVETLTVILLILVLFRLPGFINFSSPGARLRDAAVALSLGGLITLLILATVEHQFHPPISEWLIERSVPEAYGRNIVNVILVDYRALDTLGEIFVLGLAAIGVYAMIKFKAEDRVKDEREC
ncbi:putative monovalent cation/H+ antiporter subunit A [Alkalilimnicola ehrlichii]|uniref:putative monovalent cation/H+ antiporter subunit A n=1 Tax=Alkalilimnicola ehrlichii TaxID=351052 RepID=UPI003B9EAE51